MGANLIPIVRHMQWIDLMYRQKKSRLCLSQSIVRFRNGGVVSLFPNHRLPLVMRSQDDHQRS